MLWLVSDFVLVFYMFVSGINSVINYEAIMVTTLVYEGSVIHFSDHNG